MTARDFISDNADRYLQWLTEACSIPTLAGRPEDLAAMADWLDARLSELGASTERLVYETSPQALLAHLGDGSRPILVYDHYDVQPVDPIEMWASKPFEPNLRDGRFYARGSADNKGDLVARLAGIDVHLNVHGDLPIPLKFLIEGEEETGSRSFEAIVSRFGHKLDADGCIWEGAGIDHMGRPEFAFGAKGMAYVELTSRLLNDDQHSSYAVIAPSPAWHLVEALSTIRAPDGTVLIDGFYDDVVPPTEQDRELLRKLPFEEEAERKRLGIDHFVGDATGPELVERYFFAPTCNIAGIVSGFIVPGGRKTVLPKEAMAKLDIRLVPDQDPQDILAKLRRHLDHHGYGDIDFTAFSVEYPAKSPPDSRVGKATIAAAERVFESRAAVAPLMIGAGPMYPIAHSLGIPTVSPAGVCRPESNIHAPNENIRVEDYLRVIEYTVEWIQELARSAQGA